MSKRQELEKEKLKRDARMADGYSRGVSFSQGLVLGADGMSVANNIDSHGLVIPWMGSPHIRILVSAE